MISDSCQYHFKRWGFHLGHIYLLGQGGESSHTFLDGWHASQFDFYQAIRSIAKMDDGITFQSAFVTFSLQHKDNDKTLNIKTL